MAKRHLTARQLRWLFARGILKGKGSGKNRTVTYNKDRAATTARLRKRGVNVASRKKASQTNTSGRFVFGGSKAARLRSGSGASKRVVPSKAERDATRAERLRAAMETLGEFAGQRAAKLRAANPNKGLKEMRARFGGKYADTKKPFGAGDTIFYGERRGDRHAEAYQRPGNRKVGSLKFTDLTSKSARTSEATARAVERNNRMNAGPGARNVGLLRQMRERGVQNRRQLLGILFREESRKLDRPRWKKPS